MWSFFRNRRRKAWLSTPLAPQQRQTLEEQVVVYSRLSPELRSRFEDCVKILVAEQTFEGCEGIIVTADMKLTIAGHVATMLLGAGDFYFESVTSILVYPHVIERRRDGMVTQVVGEAWDTGNVILSWDEIQSKHSNHRHNVVIHEFAHHLDGLDGEMGGSIPFGNPSIQEHWERVSVREFDQLVSSVDAGRRTLLDPYGATNRGEFFAVASETFFGTPNVLAKKHTELFELLYLTRIAMAHSGMSGN